MSSSVYQTTQFKIKQLTITVPSGQVFDISGIFDELNLFESIFTPCRSGNVLIRDGVGLFEKLNFKGNETLTVSVEKSENNPEVFDYIKEFKIYKVTDRENVTPTSQMYILHFVNEDFVFSNQKKVSQSYTSLYSDTVVKILKDYLNVPFEANNSGKSRISNVYPTDAAKDFIIPNLSPFQAIEWITKRSTSSQYKVPDYLFYENVAGYNFLPVSFLWSLDPRFNINAKPKNLTESIGDELLGARDLKVLSQFSMIDSIKDGSFAGKFVGFDTYTKTVLVRNVSNAFDLAKTNHGNKVENLTNATTKDNKDFRDMYDSRVVTYPFAFTRAQTSYIKQNNAKASTFLDNTHDYVFQRRSFFSNMLQKRIELTMPGNFGLGCGFLVNLDVPKFASRETGSDTDDTLSGKYIIIATRHIIKYNKHETIIQVSTDSSKK